MSIPEILETQGDREIVGAHRGDDRLQFVPALGGDADFFALNLGGNLELTVADKAGDLLGDAGLDALLDLDDLAGVAERGEVRLAFLDVLKADVALGQLADDDFHE